MSLTLTYEPDTVTINVVFSPVAVSVTVAQARDAYQLAVAEGFAGNRTAWLESLQGPAGANAEYVVCADLAAYLALSPAVQMDGRWYLIPKT
jgi:hypothetical protein